MSILLKKGSSYNADYACADYPVLTSDWTGSVSLYTNYPGAATVTKALTNSGNKMHLAFLVGDILALPSKVYVFVTVISNPVLGITITQMTYATVSDVATFTVPMCKIFMTLG
jgi:hypothetical protein